MSVAVICDSAAALDAELAQAHGITVVPMQLEIAGEPLEESDVAIDKLVERLDDGIQTSAPSPGAFAVALESVGVAIDGVGYVDDPVDDDRRDPPGSHPADRPAEAIICTVGQKLSSTYASAEAAVRLATHPDAVRIVDTGTAAGAEGLVVLAAAQAARQGLSLLAVAERAQDVASRVHLVAAVEQLTYLVRGGRVAPLAARTGTRLGMRLVFELHDGHARPLRPSFHLEAVFDQILAHVRRNRPPAGGTLHVAALHSMRENQARDLLARVRTEMEAVDAFVGGFGPVMVAHTGPGVIGLAWWWEP